MNTPRSYFAFALKSISADLDGLYGIGYSLRHPLVVQAIAAEIVSLMGVEAALAPAPLPSRVHPVVRKSSASITAVPAPGASSSTEGR